MVNCQMVRFLPDELGQKAIVRAGELSLDSVDNSHPMLQTRS